MAIRFAIRHGERLRLLLNAILGWWWADPVAGLVMVPIIAKEGVDGLKGKMCCDDTGCT